ncbi:TPA: hypothetical protein HA265_02120 [Candidatus Woesearchaeota archaeon]|nr:hypothetical protein [Candidatus Woesearchaeota archaeon]
MRWSFIFLALALLLSACSTQAPQSPTLSPTTQEDIPSSPPSALPEGSCTSDSDCYDFQYCDNDRCRDLYCSDCQYLEDHRCKDFDCCDDYDCAPLEHCKYHECAAIACPRCFFIEDKKCVRFPCCSDSDCDDSDIETDDFCMNASTDDAYCANPSNVRTITYMTKIPLKIPMSRVTPVAS